MMNITHNDIKIPLIIGVTGHRDIPKDDIEELKKQIRKIFEYLIDKYPHTPLILLTPLADGADRIVASVALEYDDPKIAVSIPLPFDEEETYPETFGSDFFLDDTPSIRKLRWSSKNSKKEFCILREKIRRQNNAFLPTTIPMPFDSKQYKTLEKQVKLYKMENDKKRLKSMRYKQYSLVGEYIAIHSQILIALQNPDSEGANGGTAEIVNKKLSGNYEYVTKAKERVTLPERGLVYRILTPRIKDTEDTEIDKNDRFKLSKLFPSDDKDIGYEEKEWIEEKKESNFFYKTINFLTDTFTHLNTKPYITKSESKQDDMTSFRREHKQINYLNKVIGKEYENILSESKRDLEKHQLNKSTDIFKINTLKIRQIYTRRAFAYLSESYQKIMEKFEKVLLTLILISSFTFFILSKIEFIEKSIINSIYILVIFSFYIFSIVFKKYKDLYEDARALSEGMRVHIAWKDANIDESVAFSYPSSYKDELNWIRTSLRSLNIFYFPKNKDTIDKEKVALIETTWIDDQIKYFKKYKKYENIEDTYNINIYYSATIFLISGFVLAFNMIVPFLSPTEIVQLKVFSGVFLTLASFTKAKQLFDGYSKISKEYKLSLAHFKRAKELLRDDKNDKQKIYKSLGIDALQENTFWTILRREKNYKSPSL